MERTLAIIKPDAVERGVIGAIIQRMETEDLRIRQMRLVRLTKADAERFYAVHRDKRFFDNLTDFISSGPIVVLALEAPDVIRRWRRLMGATDPAKADRGTIRREYGSSIETNAAHGSDAPETAATELDFFFEAVER